MKKSAARNGVARGQRIPAENNKNTALKKVRIKQPTVEEKKHAPASDTVMLTQSEFDAIIGAIGKLSIEKGEYCVCMCETTL